MIYLVYNRDSHRVEDNLGNRIDDNHLLARILVYKAGLENQLDIFRKDYQAKRELVFKITLLSRLTNYVARAEIHSDFLDDHYQQLNEILRNI